jgi:hypothetical protein
LDFLQAPERDRPLSGIESGHSVWDSALLASMREIRFDDFTPGAGRGSRLLECSLLQASFFELGQF